MSLVSDVIEVLTMDIIIIMLMIFTCPPVSSGTELGIILHIVRAFPSWSLNAKLMFPQRLTRDTETHRYRFRGTSGLRNSSALFTPSGTNQTSNSNSEFVYMLDYHSKPIFGAPLRLRVPCSDKVKWDCMVWPDTNN